jgi:hypothetical protein
MSPYVNELMASRHCAGDERKVVCIGDSGQRGADLTMRRALCVVRPSRGTAPALFSMPLWKPNNGRNWPTQFREDVAGRSNTRRWHDWVLFWVVTPTGINRVGFQVSLVSTAFH